LKKRKKQNIALAIVGVVIIGLVISYNYSNDQARLRGENFGYQLQLIQDEVKTLQNIFESKVGEWKAGNLSKEDFLQYSQTHVVQLEELIPRYDGLSTPEPFVSSVKLFKLSTETQLESDKEYIKWIETDDESFKIRSDSLFQGSFEYEVAALSEYEATQLVHNP